MSQHVVVQKETEKKSIFHNLLGSCMALHGSSGCVLTHSSAQK